jgi:ribosomal-protein-serine acetyltransferase
MLRFDLVDDVYLRELRLDDLDELYAVVHANQAHIARWMPWAVVLRRADTEAWVQGAVQDGGQFVLIADGVIAGAMGFHRSDPRNDATSLGYWLAERHQGKGLMTAAVQALIAHAFGDLGLHRLEICCAPANARSRAIPERLGFTEEGVRRDGEKLGDGFRDLVVYSLLASD